SARRVVPDVFPRDGGGDRDRGHRRGQPGAGDPLGGDVGRVEREVERPVVVLGDVLLRLLVVRAAGGQAGGALCLVQQLVQGGGVDGAERRVGGEAEGDADAARGVEGPGGLDHRLPP